MMRSVISLYRPHYPTVLVYMLQNTEYRAGPYLAWYWRTNNFNSVMRRRNLERTRPARLLLGGLRLGIVLEIAASFWLMYLGLNHHLTGGVAFGAALFFAYPIIWAHLIVLLLVAGRQVIVKPQQAKAIKRAEPIFANHAAVKMAVVGSYGKTTMKELLLTVLSQGKKVAATPANKNVSSSHALFANKLEGDEDILIIEYGEEKPGDVARFASRTHPTHAVITGLTPAHLDQYQTLQAAGQDIFSIADFVPATQLYVNGDAPAAKPFIKPSYQKFDTRGVLGWKIKNVKLDISGTSFTITKGKRSIKLQSGLVGRHQVGFLAFVATFALEQGLITKQVQAGIAQTAPIQHRMQPYQLGGAWIIDDTYNGNLEGIRAGTQLITDLKANRKVYVTPGLVDQGEETESVHIEVGKLIAAAQPDLLVLMQNSVTDYIQTGLKKGKYKGEVRIEADPLEFYTNLQHFVAAGDLIVMQNDWTDNYA